MQFQTVSSPLSVEYVKHTLITIIGTGFERAGGSFSITDVSPSPQLQFGSATIVSDGLASAPLLATNNQLPPAGSYTLRITHLRPDGTADPTEVGDDQLAFFSRSDDLAGSRVQDLSNEFIFVNMNAARL